MSDITVFKEMIKNTAKVPLENYYDQKKVILKEKEKEKESSSTDYSVTIYGMPDDDQTIVIKADAFPAPTGIFANSKHECKRADFVIIADTDNKKVILCIEMKAGKGGREQEIIQQLKGAKCFIAYCREIGQVFWDRKNFLNDYAYRFVSIRNISIPKRPTRPSKQTKIHDQPSRMLKITSPKGLQFNSLVRESAITHSRSNC